MTEYTLTLQDGISALFFLAGLVVGLWAGK